VSDEQDTAMRKILGPMEMLAHGGTQKWNSDRNRSKPGSRLLIPEDERDIPHVYFAKRYENAPTDTARQAVIDAAQKALNSWRQQAQPENPEWGPYGWKLLVANDPRSVAEIARLYSASRGTIHELRKRFRLEDEAA
jgi:hypothetical protein